MKKGDFRLFYKPPHTIKGFTLIELVVVLVLIGIVSVVAIPKLLDNQMMNAKSYSDKVKSALMFANRLSISQRKPIVANISNSGITLTYVSSGSNINFPVTDPKTGSAFSLNCPTGLTNCISSIGTITFNSSNTGKTVTSPSQPFVLNITVSGYTTSFKIENETGTIY